MSSLFGQNDGTGVVEGDEAKRFGERYNGRYHMPLLPGEEGTKRGGGYVPRGVMSATNLAGSIVDSRSLAVWERERDQIGLARRPELYERMAYAVNKATHEGAFGQKIGEHPALKDTPSGRELVKTLADIHGEAKTAAGGDQSAIFGTNRHDVWEDRARTGVLLGTPAINGQIEALERLLDENGLDRVPGLQERVVRNEALRGSGRLDDVLVSRRTGILYLADLKTKRTPFYSWLEAWIQQVVYATAEWMLDFSEDPEHPTYIPGPLHHVSQEWAILLRMPSDGAPPYLERVHLPTALRWAKLARDVTDARSEASRKETHEIALWREDVI